MRKRTVFLIIVLITLAFSVGVIARQYSQTGRRVAYTIV
jgi:hypothetical protein